MAKLYFYYSAMNAGKSTTLLQSSYNYQERGMHTLLYTPSFDERFAKGSIHSRIGLHANANIFDNETNLYDHVSQFLNQVNHKVHCILVDEAQFLTKKQVEELAKVADTLSIPVLAYGLRTDFRGEPFEGSLYLLAWADELIEIKTICHCGKKATMNIRLGKDNKPATTGKQIEIGGNDKYISVCRKHFTEGKV